MDQILPLGANTAARKGVDTDMERMKDHVSHFVLRLAFCRSEDLQRRFVRAETVLFRLRFDTDDTSEREQFLRTLDLDWQTVTQEEKEDHKGDLLAATPSNSTRALSTAEWNAEAFFKVPWTKVPDLVEKRKVFLQGGVAWVPMREQSSLVLAEFSNRLEKELEFTARSLPRLDEDDRLVPLLNHLSLGFLADLSSSCHNSSTAMVGEDGQAVEVRATMVNALVKKHAPMCMRQLGQTLEERKHLKHQARLQFGLFLKEIGLGVEQAMLFWRRSFANMTDDKFSKEYRYNIRYNYGLEGKRVDCPARSCARIITQDTPGPQDTHGCPFRHYSTSSLSAALSLNYRLSSQQNSEILANVKDNHYHVACTRLFEITHGLARGKGLDGKGERVAHPNRYFERSWKLEQEVGGGGGDDCDDVVKNEQEDKGMVQTSMAGPSSPSSAFGGPAYGSSLTSRGVKYKDSGNVLWTKSALEADPRHKRSSILLRESNRQVKGSTPDSGIDLPIGAAPARGDDDEFGDMDDLDVDFDALDRAAKEQLVPTAASANGTPSSDGAGRSKQDDAGESKNTSPSPKEQPSAMDVD